MTKPPEPLVTGELKVTHPIDALRQMLELDIARTGPTESFMIRSGLLADLLDELARHRTAHALPGDVGKSTAIQLLRLIASEPEPEANRSNWEQIAREDMAFAAEALALLSDETATATFIAEPARRIIERIARAVTTMERECSRREGEEIAKECIPLFEQLGMSNEGEGWGFDEGQFATPDAGGWIVGSADCQKWRTWTELGPEWTGDRDKATRYARRVDAEQVHAADEDAWRVEPYSAALTPSALPRAGKFALGDRVSKKSGANWNGRVVGFYSTALTPIGYAVESEREIGSVQIYPEAALTPSVLSGDAGEVE